MLGSIWDGIVGAWSWFFRVHIIFRASALVLFALAGYAVYWTFSSPSWQPLAVFALCTTLGTFAFILAHPTAVHDH